MRVRHVHWTAAAALYAGLFSSSAAQSGSAIKARSIEAEVRAGQQALSRGDLAAAERAFAEVTRIAPENEQGHSALGAVMLSRGEMKGGIAQLRQALAIKPDDRTAKVNLALALEQVGSTQEAVTLFADLKDRAGRERQPLPATVLAAYARALSQLQKPVEAEAEMRSAIALDPESANLHDALGSLYAQQTEWRNAEREFTEAIALRSDFAEAHMHLGLALRAQEKPTGMEELRRAAELAPSNAVIALELGKAMAAGGNDSDAIATFRRVLELKPDSIEATYQLAMALQRMDKAAEAIPYFRKVVAAEPDNSEALTNLGLALCQNQDAKGAVPVIEHAIKVDPSDVVAREDLAVAFVQLNQFEDAIAQLKAAIQTAPDQAQLHYDLGMAYKWQDNAVDAIPELQTAERLNANAPDPPHLLGYLYMQEGRFEDAAREMSIALKLRPADSDGWATLGSVNEKLNDLPGAEAALREAIRQDPSQADAHLTLASVLIKQNRTQEAREERSKGADLMRTSMNHQRAEVSTHSGQAKLRAGDVNGAVAEFQDAVNYDSNYAEAHLGLAQALDKLGSSMQAAAERQKARKAADTAATRVSQ